MSSWLLPRTLTTQVTLIARVTDCHPHENVSPAGPGNVSFIYCSIPSIQNSVCFKAGAQLILAECMNGITPAKSYTVNGLPWEKKQRVPEPSKTDGGAHRNLQVTLGSYACIEYAVMFNFLYK